jgi:hypothetical protein
MATKAIPPIKVSSIFFFTAGDSANYSRPHNSNSRSVQRNPDSYRIDVNLILRTNRWSSIPAKAPADFAD